VYGYGLDGYVHRYLLFDGSEARGDGFPALITLKPEVEKCSSNLTVATTNSGASYLYATIAAYPEPGDEGDYQGHFVAIDLATGRQHVFNALCSDRDEHFAYDAARDCTAQQAGIWARAGAVYDPVTDRTFITTGNGPFDANRGGFNWGTTIVALNPDGSTNNGTPLDSYTPANYEELNVNDLDLSSTTVAILPISTNRTNVGRLAVQGGKDGNLRLVDLADLSGEGGPRHIGGELQVRQVQSTGPILTRPATWLAPDGRTWVFVTTHRGTNAYSLDMRSPRLRFRWFNTLGGTSPIIAGDILFHVRNGEVRALDPQTGKLLWSDRNLQGIHWQSPIVVNDTLYVADEGRGLTAFTLQR
jgi:outer membrane protein assembly factor BamB